MAQITKQPLFHKVSGTIIGIIVLLSCIYFANNNLYENNEIVSLLSLSAAPFSLSENSYRIFSYGFIHKDFAHLLFNTVWFIIFGTPIARHFGDLRFLFIFLGGICVGGLSHIALSSHSDVIIIGASAGVSALCGASLRFMMKIEFDFRNSPLLLRLFDTRYLVIISLFILLDIGQALFQNHVMGNNIAWYAHVAGIIFGGLSMSIPLINKNALFRKDT